jgi:hypothetical protein
VKVDLTRAEIEGLNWVLDVARRYVEPIEIQDAEGLPEPRIRRAADRGRLRLLKALEPEKDKP